MKRPIEWHEECLVNQRKSLKRAAFRLNKAREDFDRQAAVIYLRECQITEAKRRGMEAFDAARLLASHAPKKP